MSDGWRSEKRKENQRGGTAAELGKILREAKAKRVRLRETKRGLTAKTEDRERIEKKKEFPGF